MCGNPLGSSGSMDSAAEGSTCGGGELLGALCLLPEPSLLEFRNGGDSQQHWQRWYIWAWMCSNPAWLYYVVLNTVLLSFPWDMHHHPSCSVVHQWPFFRTDRENRTTHYAWLTKIARHGAQPRYGNNMLRLRSVPSSPEIFRIWSFEPDLIDDKRLIPSPVHRTNTSLEAPCFCVGSTWQILGP